MKVRDLMIRDWVQVPCLIDNMENYNAWCQIKQLRDGDLDVIGFKELSYDEIEPIPLTPEILEKNGFVKDAHTNLSPDYYYEDDNCVICINLNSTCDKAKSIGMENKISRRVADMEEPRHSQHKKCLCVHELQHALRLCGIEKEIIL